MEPLVITDQEVLARAIAEGKTNARDMPTVLRVALQTVASGAFDKEVPIKRNEEIVPSYLQVEKNFDPIPWIDTSKVVFHEVSPLIASQPDVLFKEAAKLVKGGFPEEDILPLLDSLIYQCKMELLKDATFKRTESFLVPQCPEGSDCRMLVTTMDHTNVLIYSISTEIPVNLSVRHQHAHFKSLVICLLRQLPRDRQFRVMEFDYEISRQTKLNLFICLK